MLERFQKALTEQGGLDNAKPGGILQLMNREGEPGAPTHDHIRNHLYILRRAEKKRANKEVAEATGPSKMAKEPATKKVAKGTKEKVAKAERQAAHVIIQRPAHIRYY